ncbi:MAG: carbohydrate kinase family protein [Clostridia bacterium]|nr:carbohydrate kinase family protein [Clostridia bacterium]
MKYALTLAGNIIVDTTKYIEAYPDKLELTAITGVSRSTGGSLPNVGIDLARLDPSLPIKAIGFVGEDDNGAYALETLGRYPNIDLRDVRRRGVNSFTDVMTVESTGERTFFTYKGADRYLDGDAIDLDRLDCDIFHAAYALLLDGLDAPDPEYGTVMAKVLHGAQARGHLTSMDVVSERSDRYGRIVPPALRYTDYFSVNEMEASRITGVDLTSSFSEAAAEKALRMLRDMGVRRWAVIHTPALSCGLDEKGRFLTRETVSLPEGFIRGSVGAGDAFTAGLLLLAWRGADLDQAMMTANAVAAMSLSQPGATDGVPSLDEVTAFAARMGYL